MICQNLLVLHFDFEITALSSHNSKIQKLNRDNYIKKLDTLNFFVENQQRKGNIRNDIPPKNIARTINGRLYRYFICS